jgi:hypothetical protein
MSALHILFLVLRFHAASFFTILHILMQQACVDMASFVGGFWRIEKDEGHW